MERILVHIRQNLAYCVEKNISIYTDTSDFGRIQLKEVKPKKFGARAK